MTKPDRVSTRLGTRMSVAQVTNKLLLEKFTPAAVTVNRQHQIVFYHGNTNPFLQQPTGEPTRDFLELVRPTLRAAARRVLESASADEDSHSTQGYIVENEVRKRVQVVATPLDAKLSPGLIVVSFLVLPEVEVRSTQSGNGDTHDSQVLQKELERTREELQSTIEELQTSNEEMKASSEEVMSINEELQSTNEELETSKEELQSMNEELRTVNAQLQAKVEEQEATANDLSSLLASTDIAVLFLDLNFRIRRFTPMVKDLFELIPADVGRPITDLDKKFSDPDLRPDCEAVLDRLIPREKEVISLSGRVYLRQVRPYRTNDLRIRGVVITFVEITERKRAEEALRRSEEQLRLLIEGAQDFAMLLLNAEGNIKAWNPGAERMFGYTADEAVGRSEAIIFVPEEREDGPKIEQAQAVAQGRAVDERWHLRKDGSRFWGSGVLTAVRDAAGRTTGFVKILRDETARKRAEEELAESLKNEKEARESAEESMRLKDHFLATLSHELRTPLSAIMMWIKMLSSEKLGQEEFAEGLQVIARNAEALRLLLDDLLDTSRIATGKIRLRLGSVNLAALIESAIESARFLAGDKEIKVEADLSPAVPPLALDGDRIRQVVNNLVANAVKFTPSGGHIKVTLVPRSGGGRNPCDRHGCWN